MHNRATGNILPVSALAMTKRIKYSEEYLVIRGFEDFQNTAATANVTTYASIVAAASNGKSYKSSSTARSASVSSSRSTTRSGRSDRSEDKSYKATLESRLTILDRPNVTLQSVLRMHGLDKMKQNNRCLVSRFNPTSAYPLRGGVIITTVIDSVRYFCMGYDWESGEVTDFGGKIFYPASVFFGIINAKNHGKCSHFPSRSENKTSSSLSTPSLPPPLLSLPPPPPTSSPTTMMMTTTTTTPTSAWTTSGRPTDKNAIDGSLREFKEETLNIFSTITKDAVDKSWVVYNEEMMIVFVDLPEIGKSKDPWHTMRSYQVDFAERRKYSSARKEIRGLCWMSEWSLRNKLLNNVETESDPYRLYDKVLRFLRLSVF